MVLKLEENCNLYNLVQNLVSSSGGGCHVRQSRRVGNVSHWLELVSAGGGLLR